MEIISIIVIIAVIIFLIRGFGAWMLRINEVISLLEDIKQELKNRNEYNN